MVWAQGFFFVGYFVLRGPGFCFVYRVKNAIGKYISEEANRLKTTQMAGIFWGKASTLIGIQISPTF